MKELIFGSEHNDKILDGTDLETFDRIVLQKGTKNITIKNYKTKRIEVNGIGHNVLNNTVENGTMSGIFVGAGTNFCKIEGNVISNCNNVGIYLEHHSHHNTVKNNRISKCGYYNSFKGWKIPMFGWERREGIAIDDSSDNTITQNHIEKCGLAGITTYRNCGEFGTPLRGEGANRNVITGNTLVDMPVGIWNSARAYRDLIMWGCKVEPYEDIPLKKLPKAPFQRWFNWSCILYPFKQDVSFKFPIRFKARIYKDTAIDNIIEHNAFIDCDTNYIDWSK